MGNDIGTSQDFTPGQLNVSDVDLDNIIGGSYIKTQFYTAKPSAGASPSKANFKLLLLDNTVPASPAFKLATLSEAVFDSDEFALNRTTQASPVSADKVLIGDSTAAFATKNSTIGALLFGSSAIGTLAQDDIFPIQDTSTGLKQSLSIAGLTFKLPARATAVLDTDVVPIGDTGGTATEKATLLQLASFITPAGIIMPFAGAATPSGWLECTGAAVSRTTYATLFAAIGTTWGAGDGSTTFNLPDMRGRTAVGAGTGTWSATFTADNTTEQFTVAANSVLQTGTPVVLTTTGTLPAGTSLATTYYCIRISSTVIQLAVSLANAVAGTALLISDNGTGTHTLTNTLTARTLGDRLGEESHALTIGEMPAHTHGSNSNPATPGASSNALMLSGYVTAGQTLQQQESKGGSTAHNTMPPAAVIRWIIHT